MEQASPFPRINTPPPGGSRGSNSPTFSSGAESPSCDDVRQPLLSQHETSSDPQPANSKSNNTTTHPPPGFSGNSSSQPSTSSSSAGARGLIHPGRTTVVGLSPLGKSEPIDIPPATFQSTAQSSNKTSNSQAKAIVSQSGSTATTTTTSSHSNTLSTTNHSSSSSNTAAANPGHFPFNDFGGLMQGMQSMHGISNQWPNQEAYEKFMQAKKRKDKRAKKNENKNVIAQVKAEEVDGYCGEKSINDLLESLGEVSTDASGGANDIDKKKGKKGEKSSKDKRDKRRQNKAATNNGVTSSNGSADSKDVTDNEEPMEVEEIQEIEVKETRETAKEKKKKSGTLIENGFEMNHNVYLVTAEDNLKNSENLAASTDSLNFVPVTGKRRGKKIKEEQEKEKLMKDNNKGKSREDNVRPTSASGGSVQSGPGGYGGNRTAGGSAGGQDSGSARTGNRQTAGQDTRRTSNYSLRSREVQINTEPEKAAAAANGEAAAAAVTLNHGPDDFPALNPIQDFPALSVQQVPTTDKPHIHSAWAARKPSASSTTGGGSLSAPNLPQQQQQATPSYAAVNATTGAPSGEVPNYATATNKAVAGGGDDNPNYQQDQPSKCDKLSVNKSNDTSANKTVDDVFASNAAATAKNVTSIGNAKNDKAPAGTSPNEDNSRSVNNVKKVCDNKSVVSENAKDNNNIDCEVSVSDNVMITPSNTSAAATIINTNPLLSDDGVVNIDFNDTSNAAVASNNDLDYDCASYNSMGYIAMGDDYSCHQMPPPANMNGQEGSRFEFDTRTAAGSVVGSEAGGPLSLAPEEGEISFGFDINYQLIDASLTTTESNSTTPTQDIINRGENIKENALTETGSPQAPNGANVVASTPADIGHPTAAAAGGNFNNIASLDKAIVSFSTAEGAMIVGGYHFMNTNIPPPFATNCIPVMPQIDPTGTPMDVRHHQPSGEPKEVVSPESGICSPLSWQGDGEDLAANTNTASPPLQPGSYPRRQDNRDFISELKKLNYQQLRGGSSRSPSPSARSGSAGSYTNNQHRRAAADLSFPRSDDSGLNTSNRRDMLNSEGGSIVNSPSPNHCEIVSFLQNNWEEFSKDKKVKVYGEKKEQQRR